MKAREGVGGILSPGGLKLALLIIIYLVNVTYAVDIDILAGVNQ